MAGCLHIVLCQIAVWTGEDDTDLSARSELIMHAQPAVTVVNRRSDVACDGKGQKSQCGGLGVDRGASFGIHPLTNLACQPAAQQLGMPCPLSTRPPGSVRLVGGMQGIFSLEGGREGGGVWGPKVCVPKERPFRFSRLQIRLIPQWSRWSGEGGSEFWDTPPPWVFITLKTPRWHASVELAIG